MKTSANKTRGNQAGTDTDEKKHFTLPRLQFLPLLEREFCDDYARKVLPGLRGGLVLILVVIALQSVSMFATLRSLPPSLPTGVILLLLLLASLHPRFPKVWQPAVVLAFCAIDCQLVSIRPHHPRTGDLISADDTVFRVNALLLTELLVVILGFVLTRLRFVWFAVGCLSVAALQVVFAAGINRVPMEPFMLGTGIFVVPSLAALMFVSYLQERGVRGEFLANHRLAHLHAAEQERRERTEGMLHILNQAVGGIVHDLGNPLTSVRTGAETLRVLLRDREPDRELNEEMLDIVLEGSQMLDYLRVSLLEQTRVLEGKPIPLERSLTSLHHVVEAGVRFQKPKFTGERQISVPTDDLELSSDAMKLVAVFMNLVGNALKYSDGAVKVTWHAGAGRVAVAVLDQGMSSVGVTQAQAGQLFVAFSRLAEHAKVEGTGLGLLSTRRIVEAHGGEIFVEGHTDGTAASPVFTTASGRYPSLLTEPFRTAFVVALPLTENALTADDLPATARPLSLTL